MKTKTIVVRLTDEQFNKLEKLQQSKYPESSGYGQKENNSDVIRRLINNAQIKNKKESK